MEILVRGIDHKVRPVLFILAAPDQLRIKVTVAALVGHADRAFYLLCQNRLMLGGGDIGAGRLVMLEGLNGQNRLFLGHAVSFRLIGLNLQ